MPTRPTAIHEGGEFSPVPFRVVASRPALAFAENAALGPLFEQPDRPLRSLDGRISVFAKLARAPMGLAFDESCTLWVTSCTIQIAPSDIWKVGVEGECYQSTYSRPAAQLTLAGERLPTCWSIAGSVPDNRLAKAPCEEN